MLFSMWVILLSFAFLKELVDNFFQFFLGQRTSNGSGLGVAFEEEQSGNAADTQCGSGFGGFVRIDFIDNQFAFVFFGEVHQNGVQGAPARPKAYMPDWRGISPRHDLEPCTAFPAACRA